MTDRVLGVIAGGGRLPVLVADGMKAVGVRVCGVGIRGHFDRELPAHCDDFEVAGVFRLGRWARLLKRHGAQEAVLVGRVSKARMHDPLRVVRQMPDWRAAQVWFRRLGDDRRSSTVLTAVADVLEEAGIRLIDSTAYITDSLAHEGVMTTTRPAPETRADIEHGWRVLSRTVELDIGQSLAVSHGKVIAVESVEGTDAMIERAGRLNGRGGWTLLKSLRDEHDRRFDVPTIGPTTVERLAGANAACMAVRAGGVIMIDKANVIRAADEAGIAVVGVAKIESRKSKVESRKSADGPPQVGG